MTSMKTVKGLFYIDALLKRINLAKEIFVLDIEQGNDVFIMDDLSQQKLPISFRYYDPIIKIIFNRMSEFGKNYFSQQTKQRLNRI